MTSYTEASYSKQLLVGLTDASLTLALTIALTINQQPELAYRYLAGVNSSLFVLILFVVYRCVSLLFFNQTLGMLLFRVILLNGAHKPLTFLEKILAAVFILFRGTAYYQAK